MRLSMKMVKNLVLIALLITGGLIAADDKRATQETFPQTAQAEMNATLDEYEKIKQELSKTTDADVQEALEKRRDELQKIMSALADIMDKQEESQADDVSDEDPVTEETIANKPEQLQADTHDEPAVQAPPVVEDLRDVRLMQRLGHVEKGLELISEMLIDRQLVGDACNLELDKWLSILQTRINDIKAHAHETNDTIDSQCDALYYLVQLQKNAWMRFEILTLGLDDTPLALIKEPLSKIEGEQRLCSLFSHLCEQFNEIWPMVGTDMSIKELEAFVQQNEFLTNLVREQLPVELQQRSGIKRMFGFTDHNAALVNELMSIDLDQTYPELFMSYIWLVSKFNKNSYGSYKDLGAEFITDLNNLVSLFTQRITELKYDSLSDEDADKNKLCLVLELLMTKLFKIKRVVLQAQALKLDFTNDQQSAELFVDYKTLIENKQYQSLFQAKPLVEVRDLFKTVVERYFAHQTSSSAFSYDVHLLKSKLHDVKDGAKIRGWFKWFINGQNVVSPYLDRMLAITYSIITMTTTPQQEKEEPSIMQQILSGKWWSSDKLKRLRKDGNGKIVLDLADDLQSRQFSDLKVASFHALSYLSPVLMMGLMKYLLPYASQELGKKMMAFITDQEQARKTMDKNKIIDFVMNNPAIYEEFSHKHPELIETIARQAENKIS